MHFGYNRLLSKRFPFAVYYRVMPFWIAGGIHLGFANG